MSAPSNSHLADTSDFAEGVRATAERRPPHFTGDVTAPGTGPPRAQQRFDWSDHRGPFRRVTAEQARQYDESGYFLLEGALAPAEVDALVEAIDPLEARTDAALRDA